MNETTDVNSIFAPLWRRKWLILAVGIVVAAASYFYYKRERPVFQSTTQIYLGAGSEEQAPGEKGGGKSQGSLSSNQSTIIDSIIVEKVHKQLRKQHKNALVRGSSVRAKAVEKSLFITVTTQAHTAKGAAFLANATVHAYIERQRATHRRVIEGQIAISRRQLRRIEIESIPKTPAKSTSEKSKENESAKEKENKKAESEKAAAVTPGTANVLQAANLNSKINQLEASLSQTGAVQIKPAKAATAIKLSPKPRKNAIFGFVIGIVLAAIAAYVLSRFDRRVRALAAVEALAHTQILASLPKVKKPIVPNEGRPRPSRLLLEPLRRLYSALELVAGAAHDPGESGYGTPARRRSRVILFTSADPGDGKSTLVASLALVQRDAGARVAVVEANFRTPVQAKLLGLEGTHGLADVLAGALSLEDAMQRVLPNAAPVGAAAASAGGGVATAVEASTAGSLFLLAGSGGVANPPALLANSGMGDVLRSLAEDFDYVLIDAPSPLQVSDAMPLLAAIDGTVIVARLGHTRELSIERLVQLLARSSTAPLLGAVANCVPRSEAARYGFSTVGARGLARLTER
jgi:Mrp family chromosome partitioning ATPase/capsular polysaccharide biosynthesis protein